MRPDRLAVLGLGAIGGSVAWQARRSGVPSVVGFSPERGEAVQALRAGALTDIADTPERAVQEADFVVLAAPPDAILQLLESLPRVLPSRSLLTDVASVKLPILSRAREVGLPVRREPSFRRDSPLRLECRAAGSLPRSNRLRLHHRHRGGERRTPGDALLGDGARGPSGSDSGGSA